MAPLPPAPEVLTDVQLRRVIYSNWDFQQALSALTFLMEECDFDREYNYIELRRFRCYERSAIVSFCRPFETSRSSNPLGLRALGIHLDQNDRMLKKRLLDLRRKVVAHSDDERMHFRGSVLQPFDDSEIRLPILRYSESLYLAPTDLAAFEALLRRLIHGISNVLFAIAQRTPHRLHCYRAPAA